MNMLSDEHLLKLLEGCRAGDNSAFSELVSHFTPLMVSLIRKHGLSREECFSDACMALYRAALGYNSGQADVTFGLYAGICLSHRLTDIKRANRSGQDRLSDLDVDSIAVPGGIDSRLISIEERTAFRNRARELLSDFEFSVFLLWLEDFKTAAIAAELGVGAKSVDNAKARILKKLRAGMS